MGRAVTVNVAVERPSGEVVWYGPDYGNADQVTDADAKLIGDHCYVDADEPRSIEEQADDPEPAEPRHRRSRAKSEG